MNRRARGSKDNQRRRGVEEASGEGEQEFWFEKENGFGLRRRIIEQDGEWEFERLLLKWGKSVHPHLRG